MHEYFQKTQSASFRPFGIGEKNKQRTDDAIPKKEERGIKWVFGIAILLISFVIWTGYLFTSLHLRFKKELGLNTVEYDYPLTNEYNTLKWWFIVLAPNVLGPVPLVMLALFLHYMYIAETTTKDKFYSQAHVIIVAVYIGFLITSLVYLSIEWTNSNTIAHGALSIASDFRFCCAIDVLPAPPGKTPGCPYISACGIDPVSTRQLIDDPYFVLTFIFDIGLIILAGLQIIVGVTLT